MRTHNEDGPWVAKCPGCGRMFCPDEGRCCVQCEHCEEWTRDSYQITVDGREMMACQNCVSEADEELER